MGNARVLQNKKCPDLSGQNLPYLPTGKEILFVPETNTFIKEAKNVAGTLSRDTAHPTGAVIVLDGKIIGRGANGSDYHEKNGCERKKQNIPTGEKYELCPGCDPKNHAEQTALKNCVKLLKGADLYLWGHWWCCESCWGKMIQAGIKNVFLVEKAEEKFRKVNNAR
jgi:dCMP deaminase